MLYWIFLMKQLIKQILEIKTQSWFLIQEKVLWSSKSWILKNLFFDED